MNINQDILSQIGNEKTIQKDSIIYSQGEEPTVFYYLLSGTVKIFLTSKNGNEKTLKIITDGDIFGEAAFFDGLPRMSNAKAVSKCRVVTINKPELMNYVRGNPQIAMMLLEKMSSTVRQLSGQVDGITFLPADRRIAQVLCSFSQKNQMCIVNLSQDEIASLVGTSRITVTRILSEFVKKSWLKTSYRAISIIDYDELEKFSLQG